MNRFDGNIWAKIEEHLSEKSKNICATANLPAPFAKIIRVTRVMESAMFRADIDDITVQFRATDALLTSTKNRLSVYTKAATKLEAMGVMTPAQNGMLYLTRVRAESIESKILPLRMQKCSLRAQHMNMCMDMARAASKAALDDLCGDSDDDPMQ